MKKRMRKYNLLLSALLAFNALIPGCGAAEEAEEEIALLDPVSVAVSCVAAERRDIYDYKVSAAICCPSVRECVLSQAMSFSNYESLPGEEVQKGDVLISGDTAELDKQIEAQLQTIEEAEDARADELEQTNEALEKARKDYYTKSNAAAEMLENAPDEDSKEYEAWSKVYMPVYLQSVNAELAYKRQLQSKKESDELFELDHERRLQKLQELRNEKNSKMLLADFSGSVMALGYRDDGYYFDFYHSGDWLSQNSTVMALGDTSVKELRCDYVMPSQINKAEEVFAIVNGERVEVEYEQISSEEYERISSKNGTVQSAFHFEDPENRIPYGTFAMIVMIAGERKGALCIPTSCITREGSESYVYAFDGENYKERFVQCGVSDGMYTEILSGLQDGEMVKAEFKIKSGAKEAVVSTGSVHSDFSATGYLFYPSTAQIKNPVKNGVTYLDEICVKRYQQVQQGDLIAKVHVVADTVEIARIEREIQRLNEQLAFLRQDEKENKYQIKAVNKQIENRQENLNELRSDAAVTEIRAANDGIITEIMEKNPGELLDAGASIGRLADENSCFIMVEDKDAKLSYGNTVTVSYKDDKGGNKEAEGLVVTASAKQLSKELQSGYSIVQLPMEVVAELAGSSQNTDGWWSVTRVGVKATLREMKNVLLVPKSAVTEVDGSPYVAVKKDNGSVVMQGFVAGGSDASNYWVVRGLEEGTKICWE